MTALLLIGISALFGFTVMGVCGGIERDPVCDEVESRYP